MEINSCIYYYNNMIITRIRNGLWMGTYILENNWKFHFVMVIRKIRKYVHHLFYLLLADSWRFKLIKKKMMPMKGDYRKRKKNEPKIRRKWQAGWSSVVTWPEVASSPPFISTFDVETCTRSPLFPSSGFIRLAMGIKFRPL